jgi:sorting nexin-9/18/33
VAFFISVHSPETTPAIGNNPEFTTYQITTTFDAIPSVTVDRRYSHFASLYALLLARYPIIVVPQLPAKSYIKMQDEAKIDLRRRELEIWCKRVSRHPILKLSEEMKGFLGMEHESVSHFHSSTLVRTGESDYANEVEQDLQDLLKLSNLEVQSTDFFSRVFHPEFNIDCEESRNLIGNFEQYVRNFEGNEVMREIEIGFGKLRDSFHGMS